MKPRILLAVGLISSVWLAAMPVRSRTAFIKTLRGSNWRAPAKTPITAT